MKSALKTTIILLSIVLPVTLLAQGSFDDRIAVTIDGTIVFLAPGDLPEETVPGSGIISWIDIVGDTSNSSTATGRAKGNSYRVDIDVGLYEAEFWLEFYDTQTLTFYLFDSPVEFGTYNEVYRNSEVVTGSGAGWYSSGAIFVPMLAGYHYIIAVSWNGAMTYYFGTGDSQDTFFGAHTHGYATGFDPLPPSFESLVNDQAIYHQRLTTDYVVSRENYTWGGVKALYK